MQTLSKSSSLSLEQINFLIFINKLEFGEIRSVSVSSGLPEITEQTEVYEDIKFSSDSKNSKLSFNEKSLKPQVKEFFEKISSVSKGEIESLVIKHGIPFSMRLQRSQFTSSN